MSGQQGGSPRLVAEASDRPPVILAGIGASEPEEYVADVSRVFWERGAAGSRVFEILKEK